MAVLTYCQKIADSVGAVSFPEPDMVRMQNHAVFDGFTAYLAGIVISAENGFPFGLIQVLRSPLVVLPFRERLLVCNCLQKLSVELPHLECRRCDRHDFAERFEQADLVLLAVPQGRRHLLVLLRTVVESRFTVPQSVSPGSAALAAVIVPLCLIAQHVILRMDELMFFGLD